MTFLCKACNQPINREAAIWTKAGGFTDGLCTRDFRAQELMKEQNANPQEETAIISEPTTEQAQTAAPVVPAENEPKTTGTPIEAIGGNSDENEVGGDKTETL